MKKLPLSITWTLLAAYLFALAGTVQGAVLCFGQDGHVAIEAAENGNCVGSRGTSPSADAFLLGDAISVPNSEECNPCVDVALSTMLSHQTSPPSLDNFPLQQDTRLDAARYSTTFPRFPYPLSTLDRNLDQTSLRTTILLI